MASHHCSNGDDGIKLAAPGHALGHNGQLKAAGHPRHLQQKTASQWFHATSAATPLAYKKSVPVTAPRCSSSGGCRVPTDGQHDTRLTETAFCKSLHLDLLSLHAVPLKTLQHAIQQRLSDQVIEARHHHPEAQAPRDQATNVRCRGAAHSRAPLQGRKLYRSAPPCPA